MMVGISRVMRERGCTFADAYARLLGARAIIHIDTPPGEDDADGERTWARAPAAPPELA